jgi:hypothetical protein
MTLNELIRQAQELASHLSSGGIPLRRNGWDVDVCLQLERDKHGQDYVDVKIKV